jgi:hypothetical protein
LRSVAGPEKSLLTSLYKREGEYIGWRFLISVDHVFLSLFVNFPKRG